MSMLASLVLRHKLLFWLLLLLLLPLPPHRPLLLLLLLLSTVLKSYGSRSPRFSAPADDELLWQWCSWTNVVNKLSLYHLVRALLHRMTIHSRVLLVVYSLPPFTILAVCGPSGVRFVRVSSTDTAGLLYHSYWSWGLPFGNFAYCTHHQRIDVKTPKQNRKTDKQHDVVGLSEETHTHARTTARPHTAPPQKMKRPKLDRAFYNLKKKKKNKSTTQSGENGESKRAIGRHRSGRSVFVQSLSLSLSPLETAQSVTEVIRIRKEWNDDWWEYSESGEREEGRRNKKKTIDSHIT